MEQKFENWSYFVEIHGIDVIMLGIVRLGISLPFLKWYQSLVDDDFEKNFKLGVSLLDLCDSGFDLS